MIDNIIDKNRDYGFVDLLEEYNEYCIHEGLIDCSFKTMKVRSEGNTLNFNKKYNIYFDSEGSNVSGFDYLGLYNDKRVKLVGKIKKIIVAKMSNDKLDIKQDVDGCARDLSSDEENLLVEAMNDENTYYNIKNRYMTYFIVEKFVDTKFIKNTDGGLFGSKKFNLEKYCSNFNREMTIEEIAEKLKGKEWEIG